MNKMQCARPGCGHVWDCEEQIRAIAAASVDGVLHDLSLAPKCPECGSQWPKTRANLRGGDWFIHRPYEAASARLRAWLDARVEQRSRVAIIEVGVGGNTPIVTRIPACAFASAVQANGGRSIYLRINPDPPEGPRQNPDKDVTFHRWRSTWRALEPLVETVLKLRGGITPSAAAFALAPAPESPLALHERAAPDEEAALWQQYYHDILASLHTPRAA